MDDVLVGKVTTSASSKKIQKFSKDFETGTLNYLRTHCVLCCLQKAKVATTNF